MSYFPVNKSLVNLPALVSQPSTGGNFYAYTYTHTPKITLLSNKFFSASSSSFTFPFTHYFLAIIDYYLSSEVQSHTSLSALPYLLLFCFFLAMPSKACGILVPQSGTELTRPSVEALEARSLNHWTTREVQLCPFFCPNPQVSKTFWVTKYLRKLRFCIKVYMHM